MMRSGVTGAITGVVIISSLLEWCKLYRLRGVPAVYQRRLRSRILRMKVDLGGRGFETDQKVAGKANRDHRWRNGSDVVAAAIPGGAAGRAYRIQAAGSLRAQVPQHR